MFREKVLNQNMHYMVLPNLEYFALQLSFFYLINQTNQLVWEHHMTFTLVSLLFEIIIQIFFFQITSIWISSKPFWENQKRAKRLNRYSWFYSLNLKLYLLATNIKVSKPKSLRLTMSEMWAFKILFKCDTTNLLP